MSTKTQSCFDSASVAATCAEPVLMAPSGCPWQRFARDARGVPSGIHDGNGLANAPVTNRCMDVAGRCAIKQCC
jgi:hypothetical protein